MISMPQPELDFSKARFDGRTYEPKHDQKRLSGQLGRVFHLMKAGDWWTLETLAQHCGGTAASISARIRDLRKERFGTHTVERRRRTEGTHEYRILGA